VTSPYRAPTEKASIAKPTARDPLGRCVNEVKPKERSVAYWFCVWGVGLSAWLLFGGLAVAVPEHWVVFSVILGIVTLGVVALVWPDRTPCVALHEGGIVMNSDTMLWSDVRWLFRNVSMVYGPAKIFHHGRLHYLVGDAWNSQACVVGYRLVSDDGDTIEIPTGLLEPERCEWLERQVSAPLVADARAAFRKGNPLVFGNLTVDRSGLRINDREVEWADVRDVHVTPTSARIRVHGALAAWATLPLKQIPHPAVLIAVLRERTNVLVWASANSLRR
jgi:hypothetical protein